MGSGDAVVRGLEFDGSSRLKTETLKESPHDQINDRDKVAYLELANFHNPPREVVLECKEIDAVLIEIKYQAAFFWARRDWRLGRGIFVTGLSRLSGEEGQFGI